MNLLERLFPNHSIKYFDKYNNKKLLSEIEPNNRMDCLQQSECSLRTEMGQIVSEVIMAVLTFRQRRI